MCPACLGAAAVAALKVACAGGLTAYGVKKAVDAHRSPITTTPEPPQGVTHESTENRHS